MNFIKNLNLLKLYILYSNYYYSKNIILFGIFLALVHIIGHILYLIMYVTSL